MPDRIEEELALLRSVYPGLEWRPDASWIRIDAYPLPAGIWVQSSIAVACRIPPTPGEQPYGFLVFPHLEALDGSPISNYTFPVPTCFGGDWGQFSWAPETWQPHEEVARGSNMLNFVRSFRDRLSEGP